MQSVEIILAIDSTLDQLIRNVESLENVELQDLSEVEIKAFQNTQDSLLHRLMHMDQLLNTKTLDKRSAHVKIQAKRTKFEALKNSYHKRLSTCTAKTSILSKRRSKRLLT